MRFLGVKSARQGAAPLNASVLHTASSAKFGQPLYRALIASGTNFASLHPTLTGLDQKRHTKQRSRRQHAAAASHEPHRAHR